MNSAKNFFDQQMGLLTWRHHSNYMKRLVCYAAEDFRGICPENADPNFYSGDTPIFACKFAQMRGYQEYLALANEEGQIVLYDTEKNRPRIGIYGHDNAIFDLAWVPKSHKIISAAGDHTARLFNISDGSMVLERSFEGHTRSLKCVTCRENDPSVFATGARDGAVILWDCRTNPGQIECIPDVKLPYVHAHQKDHPFKRSVQPTTISGKSSVTGLVFQDDNTLISCGAGDGFIKVWDVRKTYYALNKVPCPKYAIQYSGKSVRNGFSHLVLDNNSGLLYANCLDNVIYCYNVKNYAHTPIMTYYCLKNSTFYVKSCLSPDGNYLFSGSSNNRAYIWNVSHAKPLVRLLGHEAEVTCVAWRNDGNTVLVTCSDDVKHKIWRVGPESLIDRFDTEKYHGYAEEVDKTNPPKHFYYEKVRMEDESRPYQRVKAKADRFRGYSLNCRHSRCGKIYHDEHMMILRNTVSSIPVVRKSKKSLANKRKRALKTSNTDKTNASSSEGCITDDSDDDDEVLAKVLKSDSDENDENHPMMRNMPNFVMDGRAPHLNVSPVKKQECDWLTMLRNKRKRPNEEKESSPQITPSKKKKQNKNGSEASTSSAGSQSPLLKFFRVTNNGNGQRTTKSPIIETQSASRLEPPT